MQTFTTHSAEETFELGRQLGEAIEAATVFFLEGDLGTGKTTFAKGIAAGLGIDPNDVNSPTFTLMSDYDGRMKLYHVDLYRLDDPQHALDHIGLDEAMLETAVIVIEWAERLAGFTCEAGYRVCFQWIDDSTRRIEIEPLGDAPEVVLQFAGETNS
ncbi:MAG: tRNA (adenosine(37)-N6)-threonylcarbamoyltransferase complex ATPase subunit type 1 TsaE [Acidobacteriota bacterium]|nr:tRNA (adenosine(37)-N6)-threonylcarbamoyltransferase complex ATPase subunit type 1 TsaE [Blastocatellia bacterium]MDW8240555.1 tRNA (adenosine(37)-N6)-threonylcarbamoyltransferase complex ATPase subunit type 1 TsaE [Acidobacteriota bacterium]